MAERRMLERRTRNHRKRRRRDTMAAAHGHRVGPLGNRYECPRGRREQMSSTSVIPMPARPARKSSLAIKPPLEELDSELSRAAELISWLQSAKYQEIDSRDADALLEKFNEFGLRRLNTLAMMLDDELGAATKQEIAGELQILIGSFPNAGKNDLAVFGRA